MYIAGKLIGDSLLFISFCLVFRAEVTFVPYIVVLSRNGDRSGNRPKSKCRYDGWRIEGIFKVRQRPQSETRKINMATTRGTGTAHGRVPRMHLVLSYQFYLCHWYRCPLFSLLFALTDNSALLFTLLRATDNCYIYIAYHPAAFAILSLTVVQIRVIGFMARAIVRCTLFVYSLSRFTEAITKKRIFVN